jgi:Xaa-Pro aminopeptidase
MKKEIISARIQMIRQRLREKNIDILILTSPCNVTYTTGFLGHDSWAVITGRAVHLLTDSRYIEQAQKECPSCKIHQRPANMAPFCTTLIQKSGPHARIAMEDSIAVSQFKSMQKQVKQRIRTVSSLVEAVRAAKDTSELRAIKRAVSIATKALAQTLIQINPGITEIALAGLLDYHIRLQGATNSFNTIVAFGANGSRPHHQPGTRTLRKRDSLLIDFGAQFQGYCSDITRCFVIGRPTALFEKTYAVVQQAQAAAIARIQAGVKLTEVDKAARQVIYQTDLPVYGHGTGHGIGLEIHERPFLKPDTADRLYTGQVITIEPGIYLPGKLGIRLEEDVLVTETGSKILTQRCAQQFTLPGA